MLFDHAAQLAMHRLHHIIAAIFGQRFAKDRFKGFLLLGRRHGDFTVEHRVHELLMILRNIARIVKGTVDIGASVFKCRK